MSKFVSQIPNCPIVDDSTNIDDLRRRGLLDPECYEPRDLEANPLGSHECAAAGKITLIPEVEWKERIIEREAKKMRNLDLVNLYGIKPLHQGNTWSCWAQAPTDALHLKMADNGGPVIMLSPGSLAGPIKKWKKKGGNCTEALARATEHGVVSQKLWSPNVYNDPSLLTPAAIEDAKRHVVLEWDELEPRNWAEYMSILLTPGRTVAYCNYAMRHAVLAIDPIINARGEIGVLTRNSGLYRNKEGYTQFYGKHAWPDDAVSIRTISIDAEAA